VATGRPADREHTRQHGQQHGERGHEGLVGQPAAQEVAEDGAGAVEQQQRRYRLGGESADVGGQRRQEAEHGDDAQVPRRGQDDGENDVLPGEHPQLAEQRADDRCGLVGHGHQHQHQGSGGDRRDRGEGCPPAEVLTDDGAQGSPGDDPQVHAERQLRHRGGMPTRGGGGYGGGDRDGEEGGHHQAGDEAPGQEHRIGGGESRRNVSGDGRDDEPDDERAARQPRGQGRDHRPPDDHAKGIRADQQPRRRDRHRQVVRHLRQDPRDDELPRGEPEDHEHEREDQKRHVDSMCFEFNLYEFKLFES